MLATPLLTGIGQIAVVAADVARATAFYRDVLGLPFLFAAPGPDGAPALAFFDAGGVRLMLTPTEAPTDGGRAPGTSVLYYRTADLDATYAAVVARGAVPAGAPHLIARMPDHELWMGFIRDSEGNLLGLMSERR
ncbi:MAG TPA: VOC family protein [Gemmatirosa sp.]